MNENVKILMPFFKNSNCQKKRKEKKVTYCVISATNIIHVIRIYTLDLIIIVDFSL